MEFVNRVRVFTSTVGTGPVALGAAFSNAFFTEVEAGAVDGKPYRYALEDGNDFEIVEGIYTASGRTLTRDTVSGSKIAGTAGTTKLTLSGNATVRLIASAEDQAPTGVVCGGRLTLTSGTPVTNADVTGATAVYFTPGSFPGYDRVGLYDGTSWRSFQFAEQPLTLDANLAHAGCHAANGCFDVFEALSAGVLVAGTGPMWSKNATVTMTIASPGVVSWTAHGAADGMPIVFSTTGVLPTGVTAGTAYYVKSPATDSFNLAATPGGTAIITTGSQSGVHTATLGTETSRGTGAGTTEIEVFEGRRVNKNAITLRNGSNTYAIAARQALKLGTIFTTAAGQTEDSEANRYVSNEHNTRRRRMVRKEATDSWTYSGGVFQQANANAANLVGYVHTSDERQVEARVFGFSLNSTATPRQTAVGVGIDTLTNVSTLSQPATPTNAIFGAPRAEYSGAPGLGRHRLLWLELGDITETQTWFGDAGYTIANTYQSGIVAWTDN